MPRKRRQQPAYVQPLAKKEEVELVLPKVGYLDYVDSHLQHTSVHLRELVDNVAKGLYKIPAFQRPFVWTDEDALFLLDSLLSRYHIGSLFMWDRYDLSPTTENIGGIVVESKSLHSMVVVDGQQRLGSIARAFLTDRFRFHLMNGTFHVEQEGPWLIPLCVVLRPLQNKYGRVWDFAAAHAKTHGLNEDVITNMIGNASDRISMAPISITIANNGYPLASIVETFKRINTTGRPFSPDDLTNALRRFEEST